MNHPSEYDAESIPFDYMAASPTECDTQRLLTAKKKKDAEKRIRFKAEAKANEEATDDGTGASSDAR